MRNLEHYKLNSPLVGISSCVLLIVALLKRGFEAKDACKKIFITEKRSKLQSSYLVTIILDRRVIT